MDRGLVEAARGGDRQAYADLNRPRADRVFARPRPALTRALARYRRLRDGHVLDHTAATRPKRGERSQ